MPHLLNVVGVAVHKGMGECSQQGCNKLALSEK